MRQKLTLSIDQKLVQRIKVQAVLENRDVSDITEELFEEYLTKIARERGQSWLKRKYHKPQDPHQRSQTNRRQEQHESAIFLRHSSSMLITPVSV